MRSLSEDAGMTTSSLAAMVAFRSRVSMSAIGSVITMASPRCLRHAGDVALVGELPKTDAAQHEPAEHRTLPPAAGAPRVGPRAELPSGPRLLLDQCLLRHRRSWIPVPTPTRAAPARSPRVGPRTGSRASAGARGLRRRPVPW